MKIPLKFHDKAPVDELISTPLASIMENDVDQLVLLEVKYSKDIVS